MLVICLWTARKGYNMKYVILFRTPLSPEVIGFDSGNDTW